MIRNQADMVLVAEAANGCEAIRRFREHKPDVTPASLEVTIGEGETLAALGPHGRQLLLDTQQPIRRVSHRQALRSLKHLKGRSVEQRFRA